MGLKVLSLIIFFHKTSSFLDISMAKLKWDTLYIRCI